jgi:hypothetical protein
MNNALQHTARASQRRESFLDSEIDAAGTWGRLPTGDGAILSV